MTSHFTGTTKKQKMVSRKAASEEVRLQTTAKNRQRGCRRDVRRQTVPNACGSDQKSTIADGTSAYGEQPVMMMRLTADDVEPQKVCRLA